MLLFLRKEFVEKFGQSLTLFECLQVMIHDSAIYMFRILFFLEVVLIYILLIYSIMGKGKDMKKDVKKAPTKTLKEKRAAKRAKEKKG
jgi:hypothetical protein